MQQSSKKMLGLAGVLALALVAYLLLSRRGPSDHDQIVAQIESARSAGERHNVGEIMQIVSANYSDMQGLNVDRLHILLIQAMKNAGPIQVTTSPPLVDVHGDSATSSFHIQVQSTGQNTTEFDRNIVLTWKREDGHKFLVIPAHIWRVVNASYGGGFSLDEGL